MELLPYLGSPEQLRDAVFVHEELHNKIALLVQLLPRDVVLRQVGRPVLLVPFTSDGDFETLEFEDWLGQPLPLYGIINLSQQRKHAYWCKQIL